MDMRNRVRRSLLLPISGALAAILLIACGGQESPTGSGASGGGGSSTHGAGGSSPGGAGPGGANTGGGDTGGLVVLPSMATVAPGGTQAFTCKPACTWAIKEGASGGTVTAQGTYTAPQALGTYHLVATGRADPKLHATATIVVPDKANGTPGKWEDVTPSGLVLGDYGAGNIVTDPARPADLYVGGYGSIWVSHDYGLSWTVIASNPVPPSLALGHVLAVAGTTPATLWMANVNGDQKVFKSTDAGQTFTLTGSIPGNPVASLYSIVVDPTDANHLLSGFHEDDKLVESTDGGDTWSDVSGAGWPSGGISWFPFFVDHQDGATPIKTWFAIAQDGASAIMTTDGGAHWTTPADLSGLQHPHGASQLYQDGTNLFIAGIYGPGGGVYRSTDLGGSWANVASGNEAIVWGTSKNLYTMWGWACADCTGTAYQTAPQPGTTWTPGTGADAVAWGPNSVAVTSDGTHSVFVGSMWYAGLWRYVEP
jgi:hypothetical protein